MPRPEATRHDATAQAFLRAGAQLIDALLTEGAADRPARLRSFHYPAPLDWIRVEDIVRFAESTTDEAPSRKAFRNRWPSKDDYVRDLVVYTLMWHDLPGGPMTGSTESRQGLINPATPLSARVRLAAETAGAFLSQQPRSLLLHHLLPVLGHLPQLLETDPFDIGVAEELRWMETVDEVLRLTGRTLRPEWTSERVVIVFQALLDGLLLRHRLQPQGLGLGQSWEVASTYADSVMALIIGMTDLEASGRTASEVIDAAATAAGTGSATPVR